MVKQGDIVTVNGVSACVETIWGQGRHRVFKLDDGRTVFDLHEKVANGEAVVEGSAPVRPQPRVEPDLDEEDDEVLPEYGEDYLD